MNTLAVNTFLDRFVPRKLAEKPDIHPSDIVRTRAMVAMLICSILTPLAALLFFLCVQLITGIDFSTALISYLVVFTWLVSQHLYFQSFGNLRVTAAAYSVQYYLSVAIGAFYTGGASSPVMVLLFCSPLIAYMTISLRASLIMAIITISTGLTFILLPQQGFVMPSIAPPQGEIYISIICWLMAFLLMTIMLITAESMAKAKAE